LTLRLAGTDERRIFCSIPCSYANPPRQRLPGWRRLVMPTEVGIHASCAKEGVDGGPTPWAYAPPCRRSARADGSTSTQAGILRDPRIAAAKHAM